MNTLYWLVTITDRPTTDAFLKLYQSFGVNVSLRTVGAGTAIQETLSTLGLEKTEKAVLFAVITADSWPRIQKALRRQMRIDVPGTGIAFIVPVSSIGGKRAHELHETHACLVCRDARRRGDLARRKRAFLCRGRILCKQAKANERVAHVDRQYICAPIKHRRRSFRLPSSISPT